VAVAELEEQKNRLATYQVQARFALATMYDRAANPEPEKKDPGAAPTQQGPQEQGAQPQAEPSPTSPEPVQQPQSDSVNQGRAGQGPAQQPPPASGAAQPAQQPQQGPDAPRSPDPAASPPNEPKP
jgi:hypothetical protein